MLQKYWLCLLALLLLLLVMPTAAVQTVADNDNLKWKHAWSSPDSGEVEQDIPVPKRGHCTGAWYDMDGDGNQEFFFDDNDQKRTFVYENEGDNNYAYRWFTDYVNAAGGSLYASSGDRGVTATDLDGDKADELLLIRATPKKGDPTHIPPIRIFKHVAGSAEFLPVDWVVAYDDAPSTREDGVLNMEYYNGSGDWDKDGRGEFGINYKDDPKYYFAMIEVTPPLTPEAVQFKIEHMIEKKLNLNVSQIMGVDLDGDGKKELFLPQRNDDQQYMYYLKSTGANTWTEYMWLPTDARVYPDSVRFGGEWNFTDLDKDGVPEFVGILPTTAKIPDWAQGQLSMWVAKINPADPAHLFSKDKFYRLKTIEQMLTLPPKKYNTGSSSLAMGDADKDGLPDIYFMLGETALPSRIMDVEFVGTDISNPDHYKYYTIVRAPKDGGVKDTTMAIQGTQLILGDADKDGKPDLYHNNRRGSAALKRPGAMVWEFQGAPVVVTDNDNLKWKHAWSSPDSGEVEQDIPVPKRGHCTGAWYDMDGDGNQEFFFDDNDQKRTFVYENEGDNNYAYRWFTDYVNAAGGSLYASSGDRGVTATDLDGDKADELLLIRATPKKGDPTHIPPIRIFKHVAGSAEFLPVDWVVAYDDAPSTREDGVLNMEYYNGSGDWDKDGRGEFGINYKDDPKYYFAMIEVTPPLTPEAVQFKIEHMIEKKLNLNVSQIMGVDLDGDGKKELFLPQRNDDQQYMYYLKSTGANTWTEYMWLPTDARVYPDSVRFGGEWNFTDLDKDGVPEFVGILPTTAKIPDWAQGQLSMWVAKINPADPAHLFSKDKFYRLKTIEQMLTLPPKKYNTGSSSLAMGDADKDGLPDIYFMLGETALPSRIMDVEFVGTDISNPDHYKYYTIVRAPKDGGVKDTTMAIQGTQLILGDADKDGKPDLYHNNRRGSAALKRPGAMVWEFQGTSTGVTFDQKEEIPVSFTLMQNYPNPFNPTTTISYNLNKSGHVALKIYDIQGRLVATLVEAMMQAGSHQSIWNGTDFNGRTVATGVYFYAISSNETKQIKKMMLIK